MTRRDHIKGGDQTPDPQEPPLGGIDYVQGQDPEDPRVAKTTPAVDTPEVPATLEPVGEE